MQDELLSFMLAWTHFDAPAAFEWALSRSGGFREQASATALEAWAFYDPAAARRALESVDPRVLPIPLGEFLVAGWLKGGHHDGVIEYIAGHAAFHSRSVESRSKPCHRLRGQRTEGRAQRPAAESQHGLAAR